MKRFYLLLFAIIIFGCTKKDEFVQTPKIVTPILKSINNFKFNEKGHPLGESSLTSIVRKEFYYDYLDRLDSIRYQYSGGIDLFIETASFKYNTNNKVSNVRTELSGAGPIRPFLHTFSYQDTEAIEKIVQIGVIRKVKRVYNFYSTNYKLITSIDEMVDSGGGYTNSNKTLLKYDNNRNLLSYKRDSFDSNIITGSTSITFRYDDKINPYQSFNQFPFNAFFNIVPSIIDELYALNSLTRMLINGQNNVISYKVEFSGRNAQPTKNYTNEYEYNADNLPIKKSVFLDGVLENEYIFTYQ